MTMPGHIRVSVRPIESGCSAYLDAINEMVAEGVRALLASESGWAQAVLVDSEVAGVVTLSTDGEIAMYLEQEFQMKGVGSAVLPRTIQKAVNAGLRVNAKARTGSGGAALAQKLGFRMTHERENEQFFVLHE